MFLYYRIALSIMSAQSSLSRIIFVILLQMGSLDRRHLPAGPMMVYQVKLTRLTLSSTT